MTRKKSKPLNKKVPKKVGKFVKGVTIKEVKRDSQGVTVRLHKSLGDSGSDVRRSKGTLER